MEKESAFSRQQDETNLDLLKALRKQYTDGIEDANKALTHLEKKVEEIDDIIEELEESLPNENDEHKLTHKEML